MNIEKLINEHYHELNENDLYIWQYILHHKKECQRLSIQDLAKQCNVSHTSILRFVRKLGYEGYSEFKVYLKWEDHQLEKFDSRQIQRIRHEFSDLIDMMMTKDLHPILEMIDHANRVFVYGTGVVQQNMANELRREFIYAKKIFHPVGRGDEIDTTLSAASKDDLFIIVSLSGDNETAVNLAKALKGLHIPSIAICRDGPSLLKQYCDESLHFHSEPFPSGLGDLRHASTGHFFIISSFLFLKYLEYLNEKGEAV